MAQVARPTLSFPQKLHYARSWEEPMMVLEGKVRPALRFRFRRGREVSLDRFSPRATVLDWLREERGPRGRRKAAPKAIAARALLCWRG